MSSAIGVGVSIDKGKQTVRWSRTFPVFGSSWSRGGWFPKFNPTFLSKETSLIKFAWLSDWLFLWEVVNRQTKTNKKQTYTAKTYPPWQRQWFKISYISLPGSEKPKFNARWKYKAQTVFSESQCLCHQWCWQWWLQQIQRIQTLEDDMLCIFIYTHLWTLIVYAALF